MAGRDGDGDAGWNHRPAAGRYRGALPRVQVGAGVAGVGVARDGKTGIEPEKRYLHPAILTVREVDVAGTSETGTKERSLLERIEQFDRFRSNGAPASSRSLTADLDVEPILPDGWRSETRRRPRRRRRRDRTPTRPWVRKARWWVVVALLAGGALAAAVLVGVPRYAEGVAEERAADYRAALTELDQAIPEMTAVLDDLGTVDDDAGELTERLGPYGRFRAATVALSGAARDDLPEVPPLFPDNAIEELVPVRDRVALVAGRGDLLAGRLAKLVAYRTSLDDAFVLPDLPLTVASAEVNDVSLALAEMLADSLEVVSGLPTDPFLDEHRADVQETLDWFRTWEVDYLEELRMGNRSAASALVNQARARLSRMQADLATPLLDFTDWARDELAGLDRDVAAALVLVPQPG